MNIKEAMLYRLIDEISLNTIAIANLTAAIEEVQAEETKSRLR